MPYSPIRTALITLTGLALSLLPASSADWLGGTSTDWSNAANWSGGVPSGVNAVVNTATGNIATITGNVPQVVDVIVGSGGNTGRVDHRSGTLSAGGGNWTFIGSGSGKGTYNLANTAVTAAGLTGFGLGSGTFNYGSRMFVGIDDGTSVGVLNINTTGSVNSTGTGDNDGIYVGAGNSTGTINLQAGTVNDWETRIGVGNGSHGTLNMSGGTFNTNHWTVVGENGGATGTVTQTGGTWNQKHTDWLSIGQRGNGSYYMSGNAVLNDQTVVDTSNRGTNKGNVVVGRYQDGGSGGVGLWDLSGSASARVRALNVGEQANTNGRVNVSGNASLVSQDYDLFLGINGTGRVDVTGGTMSFNGGWTYIGQNSGGSGTLNVNGGNVSSGRYYVGQNGTATVNVTAGQFTANDLVLIADGATGTGNFNVSSSGIATINSEMQVGANGTGFFTSTGGTTNLTNHLLRVGNNAGSKGTATIAGLVTGVSELNIANNGTAQGTVNLNAGGVIAVNYVQAGSGAVQLNFNGGEIRANQDEGSFLRSITAANSEILTGGLIVNSNGHNITVATPLDGAGGLTKSGGGALTLTSSQTYAGTTTVSAGTLALTVGSSPGTLAGDGLIIVASGGTLLAGTTDALGFFNHTANNGISIVQGGVLTISAGNRTSMDRNLTVTGGTVTSVGGGDGSGSSYTLRDANGSVMTYNSATDGTPATFSAQGIGLSGNATFNVLNGPGAVDLLISGNMIDNFATGNFVKAGPGTVKFTGNNTYSGTTDLTSGTLLLGANNVLPDTAAFNLSTGTTLNTGGYNDSTGALSVNGASNLDTSTSTSSLTFASVTSWTAMLSVWNYTGAPWMPGTDKLIVTDPTNVNLANVNFYSGNVGSFGTLIGSGGGGLIGSELVPVPEPGAVFSLLLLCGLAGCAERRSFLHYRR